jgi:predicted ATPase
MEERPVRHVILSGCSGGGKSSLLDALARRGHATVEEPGRRIVALERAADGAALPWVDMAAFARRALALAARDRLEAAASFGWTFFDRGLVDAAVALEHATGQDAARILAAYPRYWNQVFLTPPWPAIYHGDDARRHAFSDAVAEYERLEEAYRRLGYAPTILPRLPVEARADLVLSLLA